MFRVGSVTVDIGSAKLYGYEHVGIGNANGFAVLAFWLLTPKIDIGTQPYPSKLVVFLLSIISLIRIMFH